MEDVDVHSIPRHLSETAIPSIPGESDAQHCITLIFLEKESKKKKSGWQPLAPNSSYFSHLLFPSLFFLFLLDCKFHSSWKPPKYICWICTAKATIVEEKDMKKKRHTFGLCQAKHWGCVCVCVCVCAKRTSINTCMYPQVPFNSSKQKQTGSKFPFPVVGKAENTQPQHTGVLHQHIWWAVRECLLYTIFHQFTRTLSFPALRQPENLGDPCILNCYICLIN